MKVVEGRHRGLTGRVLRIVKEEGRSDRALIELKSSGETITVRCSELADIDAANASGENRGARGAGAGEKRKREKREDPAWLQGNTRVRIVSKSFEGGRLYLKKGVVVDVLTPRECVVEINDSGEVLNGVPQRVLETALPKRGGRVAVVLGPHKGQRGKLLDKKARLRPCSSRRTSPCRTSPWTKSRSTWGTRRTERRSPQCGADSPT